MQKSIHLILGGSGSGKSSYAENLARDSKKQVAYVATCATAGVDSEMRERIEQHQSRRPKEWITIENRFDLKNIAHEYSKNLILLDCLTLWLSYRLGENQAFDEILKELEAAINELRKLNSHAIIVSNELGLGLVPIGAENRKFRDLCGRANQLVAAQADRVDFMVAGLPLAMKGKSVK